MCMYIYTCSPLRPPNSLTGPACSQKGRGRSATGERLPKDSTGSLQSRKCRCMYFGTDIFMLGCRKALDRSILWTFAHTHSLSCSRTHTHNPYATTHIHSYIHAHIRSLSLSHTHTHKPFYTNTHVQDSWVHHVREINSIGRTLPLPDKEDEEGNPVERQNPESAAPLR